jgi:hypothetical protein
VQKTLLLLAQIALDRILSCALQTLRRTDSGATSSSFINQQAVIRFRGSPSSVVQNASIKSLMDTSVLRTVSPLLTLITHCVLNLLKNLRPKTIPYLSGRSKRKQSNA